MTNLPQGWKMETLGEILSSDKYSIKRGPFGSALKKSFFVEKGIRIFEQYNPINNDPHWKRYFISHEKFQELEAFKATEGDLLISCSGTLGKIVELPKDTEMGIINQALLKIRLNNIKILNSYFIYYFNSPIMQEKILESTLGSAIKNIASVKILKQIEIPLPPLKEQERIVGILDESFAKIDESIKILEQDLLNLDELMQSALQKAFNPLKDNAKENYKLPQGWKWKSLGEICEILGGGTPDTKNPIFWYSSQADEVQFEKSYYWATLVDTKQKYLYGTKRKITQKGLDCSNAILLPINSVIFSSRASIGEISIAKVETATNQGYKNFICDESILYYEFLYFALKHFTKEIELLAQGTTYKEVSKAKIKDFKIPLPPLKEQEQITKHLDFIFEKAKALKELYTKELKDYEELKQSLLDKAFKGEL
ncbi:restriction endonuclease subunit S [Campylobacter jejuni]|uniref:restriction endonuclease subunit S n=2 Tax=Campylobacter jejuni TaxID=197 RepID=UPI0023511BB6|nr:restriction endonuclease subunit S [Campylobacter jejuni]MDC8037700.1 restriction endonuclease subunit S [Campylobacter jejuni]MDC8094526.1 restriction endonuclease subunit S [Campylobacter jejuni]HEB9988178.1 restriction endonuclease subunit S [Campylobacter jejuni]HEC0015686.1 restriction endonuclease subunit S [Campylobacter jejuni]